MLLRSNMKIKLVDIAARAISAAARYAVGVFTAR